MWAYVDAAWAEQACPGPVRFWLCGPRPGQRGAGPSKLCPCAPAARAHGTGVRRAPHSASAPQAARLSQTPGPRGPHGPSCRYPVYRRIKMISLPLMHRLLSKEGACGLQGNWSRVLGDPRVRGLLGCLDRGLQSPLRGALSWLTPGRFTTALLLCPILSSIRPGPTCPR